jgi:hypothetical protein
MEKIFSSAVSSYVRYLTNDTPQLADISSVYNREKREGETPLYRNVIVTESCFPTSYYVGLLAKTSNTGSIP